MSSFSFEYMAKTQASTLRSPALENKKRGEPVAYLTNLWCTPLDPLVEQAPELRQRLAPQNTPLELLTTVLADNPDIVEGDVLIANGKRYPIRFVEDWAWDDEGKYVRLIVEQLKSRG